MDDAAPDLIDIAAPQAAWMPRRLLSIGVTGHRLDRLGDHNLVDIGAASAEMLAAIEAAAGDSVTSFRLVTGLAEGADSIVADAAVTRGWTLDVVLPFGRDDYLTDFPAGDAREAHRCRLAEAHAVFELPGDRAATGGSAAAYGRAGRVVLAQSDLLSAIWDGGPGRGRGGAAQIVAEAVLQCIPVLHIDPAGAHPPRLLWDGLEEHDIGQQTVDTVARGGLDRLPELVRGLLDPPTDGTEQALLRRFERGEKTQRRLRSSIRCCSLRWGAGSARQRLRPIRRRSAGAGAGVVRR